jgi:GT2 family glycosyltransferase
MLVSIVILNWNGISLLKNCLDSVFNQTYSPIEVITVDNGSTDGSIEILKDYDLKLIENNENLGFAKGINIGIRHSKGEYILPLNNDVVLDKNYVSELVKVMENDLQVGSAAGKLIWAGTGGLIDSAGHSLHKNRLPRNIGTGKKDGPDFAKKKEVFGVCGAAPLYRRKMLEDIEINGEFYDESFFSFLEDVDLDWRARLLGWKSFYVPEAVAMHHRGGTAVRRSKIVEVHNYKNRYLMIMKNDYLLSNLKNIHQIIFTDIIKSSALFFRYPSALLGIFQVIKLTPATLRKRWVIKKKRKMSRKEMEKWFIPFEYKPWFSQHLLTDVYDLKKENIKQSEDKGAK